MKSLVIALASGLAALTAEAVPILTLDFSQNDWTSTVTLYLTDNSSPVPGRLFIDNFSFALGDSGSFQGPLTVGVHGTSAIPMGSDDPIFGPSFTVVAGNPQTEPAQFIVTPDSGSTATLLALGGLCVIAHRRRPR